MTKKWNHKEHEDYKVAIAMKKMKLEPIPTEDERIAHAIIGALDVFTLSL
jgi:hypothetical protein